MTRRTNGLPLDREMMGGVKGGNRQAPSRLSPGSWSPGDKCDQSFCPAHDIPTPRSQRTEAGRHKQQGFKVGGPV